MQAALIVALSLVAAAAAQSCPGGIPASEASAILAAHNKLRQSISSGTYTAKGKRMPAAKSQIPPLSWNCSIAQSAQSYADRCPGLKHSQKKGFGENLYIMWGSALKKDGMGAKASASWEDEFQKCGWSDIKLTNQVFSSGIGHATQMAWAKTTKIGCGMASCKNGGELLVVCQYQEPGNMLDTNVYESR